MDELKVGLVINDRYRLIQYIGSGSFGEVWMARDLEENKDVAIKLYLSLDEKGREEFLSEYKVAYGLNHPNLVITEKYETWKTRPFLIMKYCAKGSSSKAIGNLSPSAKDEKFIWKFIHDVASGLAYLHNQTPDPIVHQDIKPDNILVDMDGSFLISDFGISKRIRSTLKAQSTRALKAGATAYMGPERFSKNPSPVTASDIWSLGASIYELAEGELPFAGMGGIFLKNGGEMADLGTGWSEKLNDIMHNCLSLNTWDRLKPFELEELTGTILSDYDNWYSKAKKIGIELPKEDPRSTKRMVSKEVEDKDNAVEQKGEIPQPVETAAKSKWKAFAFIGVAVFILLIAGISAYFALSGSANDKDAIAQKCYTEEYLPSIKKCQSLIEKGNQAEFRSLISAYELIDKIDSLETIYKADNPNLFNQGERLKNSYEEKAIPASIAWAESARTQIRELDNKERALEYYKVAYSIYQDPDIKKEIESLEQ